MARRGNGNVGVYRREYTGQISGGLNRMASPWANQGTAGPGKFPCYDTIVDDDGDGTAAGRKRARGLYVPDPLGFGIRRR